VMATKSWREIRAAANVNEERVAEHRKRLDDEVRAWQLAEVRKSQDLTQEQVADSMGVRQPRISQLENGDLSHIEIATLRSYVAALGGHLRVVAEFGDSQLLLAD